MIPEIDIKDYSYPLTEDRIAKYPLPERDSSKLLVYRDGEVSERVFRELPSILEGGGLMVFNDTRVVPARLRFEKHSGAQIEIFCLEPCDPPEYDRAFAAVGKGRWRCVIGNSKRWKEGAVCLVNPASDAGISEMNLQATLIEKEGRTGIVEFTWDNGLPFSGVLEAAGTVPIPPYLNRKSESIDLERYQTTYARWRGSVAAPTAGLHFTPEVIDAIRKNGTEVADVCLHVGAGTFLPVKSGMISGHEMHREPFSVKIDLLRKLRDGGLGVTAVGTTSVRTLESLYYAGVSCIEKGYPEDVSQWAPYEREYPYSTEEAIDALVRFLEERGEEKLILGTRIIIVPGFRWRIVERLVTNFHQSESTLILLVAAFVGEDWRKIYDFALRNGFRFLSYGDSSLLYRKK